MTFTYFQGHSKVENIQFKIVYFLSKFWSDWAQTLCAGSCYIYMNNIVHKVFFVTLAYIFNWTSLGKNFGVGFLSDAASMWDLWNSAGWSLSLSFTHDSYRFTWPWPIFEGHRRVEKYWKWYIYFCHFWMRQLSNLLFLFARDGDECDASLFLLVLLTVI